MDQTRKDDEKTVIGSFAESFAHKSSIDYSIIPEDQIWDGLPKNYRIKKKLTYIRNHSDVKQSTRSTKFFLLMWKNFQTLKRNWICTLIESLTPIIAIALMTIIVSKLKERAHQDSHYDSFPIRINNHTFQECKKFIFIPNVTLVRDLMKLVEVEIPGKNFEMFESEKEIDAIPSYVDFCAAIVFFNIEPDYEFFPQNISYKIRMTAVHPSSTKNQTAATGGFLYKGDQWQTDRRTPKELITGPRNEKEETGGSPGYYDQGFLYLQNLVDEKIAKKLFVDGFKKYSTEKEASTSFKLLIDRFVLRLRRFSFPEFKDHGTVTKIHEILPIVIVVSYLVPVMLMVWGTIIEKESGVRIQMKNIGIPLSYHRFAWILRCLLVHIPGAFIITAILDTNWTWKRDGILTSTNPFIFFLMLSMYIWQTICTVVLFNTFFKRASTATVTAGFFWFATFIPYYYVKSNYTKFSFGDRLVASILGNTAISLGCHLISASEGKGLNITWNTLYRYGIGLRNKPIKMNISDSDPDPFENASTGLEHDKPLDFTLGWIIFILFVNGVIFIILAGYIARINPDTGLTPLPWNYFLTAWYWKNEPPPIERTFNPILLNAPSIEDQYPDHFERQTHIKRRKELQVEKLTKFIGADRILNKINLDCYESHLTLIIGEKTSGKSILLSIISGFTSWTKGSIVVSRVDLAKQTTAAKSFIGYCPEDNVHYQYLTVEETLHLYVQLKCRLSRLEAWDEVERFLSFTMLHEYRYSLASELTPSAQRILLIACAFIGGSRVVLLDEPTIGMSSGQKRMVWEFIARQKKHRTILISMESMNESELIADRILYLSHGEISVNGSLRFLQQKFRGGYHLIIEKDQFCNTVGIVELVQKRIMGSSYEENETELDFFLPEENTPAFPGLFEELEKKSWILGNKTTKCCYYTMDEVLLNIQRMALEIDAADPSEMKQLYQATDEIKVDENYKKVGCFCNFFREFKELMLKNIRFTIRRKFFFLAPALIPLILIAACEILVQYIPFNRDPGIQKMDLKDYRYSGVSINCVKATYQGTSLCENLENILKKVFDAEDVIKLKSKTIDDDYIRKYRDPNVSNSLIPLVAVEVAKSSSYFQSNVEITGYFDNQYLHLPSVVLSIMDNAILDYMVSKLTQLYPQYTKENGSTSHFIEVTNHPLPFSDADKIRFSGVLLSIGYFLGFLTSLGYCFIVACFIIMPIKEREFRHVQMMSGANTLIFWGTNYLWNFIYFTIVAGLNCVIFLGNGIIEIKGQEILYIFALLESFGFCSVLLMGAWSIIPFAHWGLALSHTFLISVLTGPLLMLLMIAFSDPSSNFNLSLITFFHNTFLLLPNYSLGVGMFYITANAIHKEQCKTLQLSKTIKCPKKDVNIFNEFEGTGSEDDEAFISCCFNKQDNQFSFTAYGIGRNLMSMLCVSVVALLIRIFHESILWSRIKLCILKWKIEHKKWFEQAEKQIFDYDVLTEAIRVHHTETSANNFVINNLTKEDPGVRKVNNLFMELDRGECFCLLGAPGAGKTVTMQMLAGICLPTMGDVTINSISLTRQYHKYIRQIGYCPEKGSFLDELSGSETLRLIGVLRKIPTEVLDGYITNWSLRLLFIHDLENRIQSYSKISLKKLSAAVAMLGYPPCVLIEEPTVGLDLNSREYLFKSIKTLTNKGSIVFITSQNVALCEPVCTKMSIIVNGSLRCFGSPEHIKKNFSEGFTIIVKLVLDPKKVYFTSRQDKHKVHERKMEEKDSQSVEDDPFVRKYFDETGEIEDTTFQSTIGFESDEEDLPLTTWEEDLIPFMTFFERSFPYAILVDKHPGFVHYHIRQEKTSYSVLYTKLEEAKVLVAHVLSYYIGETNLDQAFMNFVSGQRPYE